MDIFSTQIVAAIKKIRTQKGRPDSDKIFKEIVKESATNFTMEDIQQAVQHMVSDGKLINIPHKSLDSYYVVARYYISLMDVAQNLIFITSYYIDFKLLMILFSF